MLTVQTIFKMLTNAMETLCKNDAACKNTHGSLDDVTNFSSTQQRIQPANNGSFRYRIGSFYYRVKRWQLPKR